MEEGLPPQLVEPVAPHSSEEVGVGQHHGVDRGVRWPPVAALPAPGMAELGPGALQDGWVVDEVLAEDEGSPHQEDEHHRRHPFDAKSQHLFVIRRSGCPELAHRSFWRGPSGIFTYDLPPAVGCSWQVAAGPRQLHVKSRAGCVAPARKNQI